MTQNLSKCKHFLRENNKPLKRDVRYIIKYVELKNNNIKTHQIKSIRLELVHYAC